MTNRKIILFLAIILPLFIPLLLKLFGKNHFAIEPLYQKELKNNTIDCNIDYTIPYTVAEHILQKLKWKPENKLTLYTFGILPRNFYQAVKKVINEENHIDIHLMVQKQQKIEDVSEIIIEKDKIENLKKCVFLMDTTMSTVAVDKNRRIRGYYALNSRQEVDRLLVEIDIFSQED